jgi:glycosyltransferase involved in cell wall biosynthesis
MDGEKIINVITRFSRERGFKKCLASLNSQGYENIKHFITYESSEGLEYLKSFTYRYPTEFIRVPKYNRIPNLYLYAEHHDAETDYSNWDWDKWGVQVVLGDEIPPRQEIACDEKKYEVPGWWCMGLPHSLRRKSFHAPYNLYVKIAEQHVKEGWILYLDDDDVYTSPKSIQIIVDNINKGGEDCLYTYKMIRETVGGENLVPSSKFWKYHLAGHPIIYGEAGAGTFCFHSKYKKYTQWGHWSGDDYRTLKALEKVIGKKYFINEVLYSALKPGAGNNE